MEQAARGAARQAGTCCCCWAASRCGEGAQSQANRIAAATGCRLLAEGSNARIQRGQGRLPLDRVPYVMEQAVAALKGVEHLVLVNAKEPIGFFGYPGKPSRF